MNQQRSASAAKSGTSTGKEAVSRNSSSNTTAARKTSKSAAKQRARRARSKAAGQRLSSSSSSEEDKNQPGPSTSRTKPTPRRTKAKATSHEAVNENRRVTRSETARLKRAAEEKEQEGQGPKQAKLERGPAKRGGGRKTCGERGVKAQRRSSKAPLPKVSAAEETTVVVKQEAKETEGGPSRPKRAKKTGNRGSTSQSGGVAAIEGGGSGGGRTGRRGKLTHAAAAFAAAAATSSNEKGLAEPSAVGTAGVKQEPLSEPSEQANTGSCSSSTNSVFPQGEGSGGRMADSSGQDQAGAQGGSGNGGNEPVGGGNEQPQPTNDEMEMGRLQAMLEARGLTGNILGALGPRIGGLLGRNSHHSHSGGSKIQPLLQGIQKTDDESQQLQSVIELCNMLVMGNEETLGSNFPIKEAVRALIKLMQLEHNFDIMNHAVRAITYLMEALPRSTPVVVEAIPQLLERLNRIECMDVAEQSLTALELLSRRHAKNILTAGGISACLQYLDFFSLVPQRTALQVASNCCSYLSPDDFHYVKDSIPLLTQRLCLQDKKSVESVSTLFTRLVDNFLAHPDKLQEITNDGLMENVQQLLVVSPPVISTSTFVSIVRMMHLLCAHCTELAVKLHKQGIVETIRYLLVGSSENNGGEVELVSRTPQEQHEIVTLIGELMPRLPREGIFEVESLLKRPHTVSEQVVWSWKDDRAIWRPYTNIDNRILEAAHQARESEVSLNAMGNTYTVDLENMVQVNDDTGTSRQIHRRTTQAASQAGAALAIKENAVDARLPFLDAEPEMVEAFVRSLFPVLYEVYSSSAGPAIRHECLRAVLRMIYHSKAPLLKEVLENVSVSSHIANMLSSSDLKIVVGGLQLVRILLEKVPDVFSVYFRREGVTHQVEKLVSLPSPAISSAASPQKSASDPSLPGVGLAPQMVQFGQGVGSGYPFMFSSSHLVPPAPYYSLLPPTSLAPPPATAGGAGVATSQPTSAPIDPSLALGIDSPMNFLAACRFSSVPGTGSAVMSGSSAVGLAPPPPPPPANPAPTASTAAPQAPAKDASGAPLPPPSDLFGAASSGTAAQNENPGPTATVSVDSGVGVFQAAPSFSVPAVPTGGLVGIPPPPQFGILKYPSAPGENGSSSPAPPIAPPPMDQTALSLARTDFTSGVTVTKARSESAASALVTHDVAMAAASSSPSSTRPASASKRRSMTVLAGSSAKPPRNPSGPEKNNNEKQGGSAGLSSGSSSSASGTSKVSRRRASTLQEYAAKKQEMREKERMATSVPMTRSRVKGAAAAAASASRLNSASSAGSPHPPTVIQPKSLRGKDSSAASRRSSSTDPSKAPGGKKSGGAGAFLSEKLSSFPLPRWAKPSNNGGNGGSSGGGNGSGSGQSATAAGSGSGQSASRKSGQYPYHPPTIPLTSTASSMRQLISAHQSTNSYHSLVASQVSIQSAANKEKVKQWIRDQSKELMESYFLPNGDDKESQGLNVLTKLCAIAEDLKADVDLGRKPLENLERTVIESDVSAFEILHSGLIASLYKYLCGSEIKFVSVEKRLRRFASVFLNIKEGRGRREKTTIDLDKGTPALSKLIFKLNQCLNQIEQFPVKVHELPGGPQGSLRGASALRFFHSHQIKCVLRRHPSCKELREWRRGPIKVDSLAQISAIERYMVLKGYGRPRPGTDANNEDESSDDGGSDEDLEEALAMGGMLGGQHRIQFLINDKPLPYEMTLYQAVRQHGLHPHGTDTDTDTEISSLSYAAIWVNTHNLWYRMAPEESNESDNNSNSKTSSALRLLSGSDKGKKSPNPKDKKDKKNNDTLWTEGIVPVRQNPLQEYLEAPALTGLDSSALECLSLVRTLYGLNRFWWTLYKELNGGFFEQEEDLLSLQFEDTSLPSFSPVIPTSEFVNAKLTAKVARQIQDPLTVLSQQIPGWMRQLAFNCPFVLSFESRQSLFYSIAFDRDRALQRLVDTVPDLAHHAEGAERITPRLEKKKIIISRDDMVKQAEQHLSSMDGSARQVLEVQYQNEEGTGLGPTLEFYALISRELQRGKLDLWRGEKVAAQEGDAQDEYFFNGQGLYPAPAARGMKQNAVTKIRSKFQFIGRALARTILDSRMLDLPLSPVFYKWLLGQETTLSLADLAQIDPTLLRSLQTVLSPEGGQKEIETLDLDFTLPGTAPALELRKGGKDLVVTSQNAQQYVKLVAHWILFEGVSRQMEAVIEGFEKVMPIRHLKMFYPEEMEQLFCGSREEQKPGSGHWDSSALLLHLRPDHGYNHDSPPVQWLVELMAGYSKEQQRKFLHFVTGSPKLPVGGFRSLSPPLTVVRKTQEGDVDQYLPSVMTCANYLKLPEYSSIEVMRDRLDVAMRWGQKSFHLS